MVGAIAALHKMRISPRASFSFLDWTVFVIFIVVIGGIGSLEEPIIGSLMSPCAATLDISAVGT